MYTKTHGPIAAHKICRSRGPHGLHWRPIRPWDWGPGVRAGDPVVCGAGIHFQEYDLSFEQTLICSASIPPSDVEVPSVVTDIVIC